MNNATDLSRYSITVAQAVEKYEGKVTTQTLRRWIDEGKHGIKAIRIPDAPYGRIFIDPSTLPQPAHA